ncbi:trigger factor [Methylobacter sp. Wu8]|uniref:Trigger factor n=1 Tax=Methylobacter tundripaludum TaxID=173365 RepID=A0A2S6H535_9GAMM|nr:trigger factor [Methylobacter tundripaludum]MCK9636178.1 trigger factor [Methylobacter tundripaludum]PPK72598.1 trigger factor [Methylobacter tundripaludum]
MQVSVEKTSELSRKMTVSVPEEVVQEKMAARLKSLAREVKIDGFRPGKAPQHVIKKMYGDRVRGEIAGDLVETTYFEALKEQDLRPAGYPHIQSSDESDGFKYTAEFEVYPEISLEGIDQIEVVRPVATVQDVDVDGMIEKLRAQKKSWATVERASQEPDRVTISFSGVSEGENFTDGKVENYSVEIGAKQMIPGFEENLVGLSVGEKKTFEVSFPEEYGNEKLAGKVAEFEVEVISVEEPVLPEIDDAFIKAYGIDGSVDAFREDIKSNLENELEQALRNKLKNAVMNALAEKIQISVPNTLVDQEVESMMKPYIETAKRQKMKLEDLKLPRDAFEEQAKRRVALGLILSEIIHENGIKVDDNKVRSTIEDMAKSYERPKDVVEWYYSDENRLNDVRQMVLENQTIDWLVAQAKVTDETISFSDAMNKQG